MPKFAAYDAAAIYAVSDTAEAAIAQARADSGAPDAQFDAAPISDTLATWIDENGWDGKRRTFARDANGFLIDTTDAA